MGAAQSCRSLAPGFGLSRARSKSASSASSRARSRSNCHLRKQSSWGRQLAQILQDSKVNLSAARMELEKQLRPPSRSADAWRQEWLAPMWIYLLCALSVVAGVALLIAAFAS